MSNTAPTPAKGRLGQMRAEGRDFMIGVAGCVAQAEGEEIARRAKGKVDLVFGPQSYHRLPALIARATRGEVVVETEFPEEDKFEHLPAAAKAVTVSRGLTAFLTVQEGCDKFCTFCVVPYTRGAETSRPLEQVLVEARTLVDAGVRDRPYISSGGAAMPPSTIAMASQPHSDRAGQSIARRSGVSSVRATSTVASPAPDPQ